MKKVVLTVLIAVLALSFITSVQAGLEDGLVLYLPFDEGSGETTADLSGGGHDGDINGATWADGRFGKALSFSGDGDFVPIVKLFQKRGVRVEIFSFAYNTAIDLKEIADRFYPVTE